jgi:hypothetical protein
MQSGGLLFALIEMSDKTDLPVTFFSLKTQGRIHNKRAYLNRTRLFSTLDLSPLHSLFSSKGLLAFILERKTTFDIYTLDLAFPYPLQK